MRKAVSIIIMIMIFLVLASTISCASTNVGVR